MKANPYSITEPDSEIELETVTITSISEETQEITDGGVVVEWNDNPLKLLTTLCSQLMKAHLRLHEFWEMVGQINFWNDENEWKFIRYDDPDTKVEIEELKTIKNVNYNYNFHDADWNNVANSGGNARYIVDEDDDGNEVLVLDEVGSNIGFMQRINEVDPDLWEIMIRKMTQGPLIGTMLLKFAMRQIPGSLFLGMRTLTAVVTMIGLILASQFNTSR